MLPQSGPGSIRHGGWTVYQVPIVRLRHESDNERNPSVESRPDFFSQTIFKFGLQNLDHLATQALLTGSSWFGGGNRLFDRKVFPSRSLPPK